DTFWSDGKPLTAVDLRHTLDLMHEPRWPGYVPEWAELVQRKFDQEGDAFHLSLSLSRGYIDPLSMMDFKVLPGSVELGNVREFAKSPVGSGPFMLQPPNDAPGGKKVIFAANPYYANRPGKADLPHIREIHFFHSNNPAADFQNDHLHLLLDLPTKT